MIFGKKTLPDVKLYIQLTNNTIPLEGLDKSLGSYLDSQLNFSEHIRPTFIREAAMLLTCLLHIHKVTRSEAQLSAFVPCYFERIYCM